MKKYIDPIHHRNPTNFTEEIYKKPKTDTTWNVLICLVVFMFAVLVIFNVVRYFTQVTSLSNF